MTRLRGSGAEVVAGQGIDAAGWLDTAVEASALVVAAELGTAAHDWLGVLVVEVPSTPALFILASGLPPATAAVTAAVTVMSSAVAVPRIIVNQLMTPTDQRRAVLVHEGVHAATRSPVSQAPRWAVEGIAESVTAAVDPPTRDRNAALVTAAPRPAGLPSAAELDGADAALAYARAAVAVEAAIARWGRSAFTGWLADWEAPGRPTDSELTETFLAALPAP